MAIPKTMDPQTDFSAGEIDEQHKRSDDPVVRTGARQMLNWRILNSKRPQNRPGRSALWVDNNALRVDAVQVSPVLTYGLQFGPGSLAIRDVTGAVVAANAGYPWSAGNINFLTWAQVKNGVLGVDVVITFDGQNIWLARFDGVATWSFPAFAFATDATGALQIPYFRLAPPGMTLTPSGYTGAVTLTASADYWVAGMIGSSIRLLNHQITLIAYTSPMVMSGTIVQPLTSSTDYTLTSPTGTFTTGEIVINQGGSQAEVVSYIAGILRLNHFAGGYNNGDSVTGPSGRATINVGTNIAPQASLYWDEQVVSNFRGWPRSVSADQQRLIFADLPAVPDAGMWSTIGLPFNFSIGALPSAAMMQIATDPKGRPRIYHIIPSDGGEMVFTDRGVYYIPISETNPLTPSSVVFKPITPDASAPIRPVRTAEAVLYVNAGANRVIAVVGTGSATSVKPYLTRDVTEMHTELFTSRVKTLAVTTGDGVFPERYIYVLKTDGTIAVGRYEIGKEAIGWVPWNGAGTVSWLSSLQSGLIFTTAYAPLTVVEALDDTTFLDAAVRVNAVPTALAPPLGKGPLYHLRQIAGSTVSLIDLGTRYMGTYQIDAEGFLVPQNIGGENLASAQLVAGQPWTAILEPFVPHVAGGQSVGQRMRKRRVADAAVSVADSTGFVFATLYSGAAATPAQGTVIKQRRVPPYLVGEAAELAAPRREGTWKFRPTGRSHDPRLAVVKDTPGPLRVLEIGMEVSV